MSKIKVEQIDVPSDGNCFFHSLSYLIKGTSEYTALIRKRLCEFGRENPEILSEFNSDTDNYNDEYYDKMSKDHEWADAGMLLLATSLFKMPIAVYVDGIPHFYSTDNEVHSGKTLVADPNKYLILEFVHGSHYRPLKVHIIDTN